MIEMLILAMIASSVTLRVAGNVAVDGFFAARGMESPRYKRAKARLWAPRKPSGAASRYWSQIWEDSWTSALDRHNRKRSGRRPDKPRGAATVFWSRRAQEARGAVRRKWDRRWEAADEKWRSRSTRVPDGTDVVPGAVVPDAPVPPEPEPVLVDLPDGGTDLQFGTDPTDPTGTRSCPGCGGAIAVDGEICGACQYRQQQRSQYHDQQQRAETPEPEDNYEQYLGRPPLTDPAAKSLTDLAIAELIHQQHPLAGTTTQEGSTTMTTMPTAEVVGLDQAISYCEASAIAHREQIVVIEQTQAALAAGDVTGPAAGHLATAQDANATAQAAMTAAATELRKQKVIQEQYDAVQGAGTREFITNGR